MKKINLKYIFVFILGFLLATGITVYATSIMSSSDVSYDNTSSNLESTNVKDALDELYTISETHCPSGYECKEIGACSYEVGQTWTYSYVGYSEEFVVPCSGTYKFELWGASGGSPTGDVAGKGGYVSGTLVLEGNEEFYVYVGASGPNGGYNGGGKPYNTSNKSYGGGASDIRLINGSFSDLTSLKSRILVAGGGGSGTNNGDQVLGDAGGISGYNAYSISYTSNISYGGSQTAGGTVVKYGCGYTAATSGSFGIGGTGGGAAGTASGGGGGGYYGGGGGADLCNGSFPAGGGSSYISGYSGCNSVSNDTSSTVTHTGNSTHYSNYVFKSAKMIDGRGSMPTFDGSSTQTGNSGNGYAKITLIAR